jgi:GT2 family glycosyltransferase
MNRETPLVSIIAVNYNATKDTLEFLESARRLTYPNVEIILVDNASRENPEHAIVTNYREVKFIRSEVNLGFAGGNNLGIKVASGDYFFFLNNDTILYHDFLEPIIAFMESHKEVGMATPKVLYPDGKTIQYAGAIGISPYTGRGKRLGLFEEDKGQYDKCYKTDLGHGAALIVPRKVVEEVGVMPELFFLYYEEHDWCEQVKRAGYSMFYLGNSKILHKESVSTGGDESPLKVYYLTRNRILFMRRNFGGLPYVAGLLFFFLVSVPKNTLKYLFRGKTKLLKSFYQGIVWNLLNYNLAHK